MMRVDLWMMRVLAIGCLACSLTGCDDESPRSDAGSDALHDADDDALIIGDADFFEDGSIVAKCGTEGECGPNQFCVYPQCGHCITDQPSVNIPCPAPYCVDVSNETCKSCGSCFEGDPCNVWGECLKILDKRVICGCPRDHLE